MVFHRNDGVGGATRLINEYWDFGIISESNLPKLCNNCYNETVKSRMRQFADADAEGGEEGLVTFFGLPAAIGFWPELTGK